MQNGPTMHRVLIVGGGSIGERHLRCFLRTRRAKVALCEINEPLRTRLADEYGLQTVFANLDCVRYEDFDAAVICVPAHLHVPMAVQLAGAGLGLLIEKPLSTSESGIEDFVQLIEREKVRVSVAYVLRHQPALIAMRQAVLSNQFGSPVEVVMTSGQHFPYYRPAYRETYYTSHETGGGAIQDALTHMLNAAEWIVGPVTQLVADAEHCVLDGVTVEDTVHLLTRHGSVLGAFSLNQHQFANETTLTVHCQHGSVRYEGHNSRWLTCRKPDEPWHVEQTFHLERDDLFIAQANRFLDQLEGKVPAGCSVREGWQTLKVNLAALQSVRSNGWIRI